MTLRTQQNGLQRELDAGSIVPWPRMGERMMYSIYLAYLVGPLE
jgi:hypothetical protein